MTLTRGHVKNAAVTPLDTRLMAQALITQNADGSARTGVLGANPTIVSTTATTSPMTVNVATAEFVCSRGKADGITQPNNDGVVAVPIAAAPVSNSRITVIWVKQNDDLAGDANALPVFGTTDGAALPTPTEPAIPTGATRLATLRVYSGTTASNAGSNVLTNVAQMTVPRGAPVPFRTKAELDLWTTPVTPAPDAYALDNGVTYRRLGGAWRAWESDWIAYVPSTDTFHASVTKVRRYKYVAGQVVVEQISTITNPATAMTGDAVVSLPVPAAPLSNVYEAFEGRCSVMDISITTNRGAAVVADGSSVNAVRYGVGYDPITAFVNNTVPMAVGAGDVYKAQFKYNPA